MKTRKATRQLTKNHNRDLVLKMIIDQETTSRADIARLTKLTRTTVSEVVANLISAGLVQEVGPGTSKGGKPSILISLIPDSRYMIGVNLSQEKFIGSIVNLRGEIKETVEVPVKKTDGHHALSLVYAVLDDLLRSSWRPIIGIGVGAPGLINTREGVLIRSVNLEWRDLPLGRMLHERYKIPVSVMNDSQATAIGEYVYGDHDADSHLIVVTVKHGIGAGLLINGQLFQGDGGGAGEIGHIVIQEDGIQCRCGQQGCLETIASAHAVSQRMQALTGEDQPVSLEAIQASFLDGDPAAQQVVLEAGKALGKAMGALVGALNIQKIILTGEMTLFGEPWLEAIRETMLDTVMRRMARETQIEFGKLDYRACILGASAHLLLDNYSLLFTRTENLPALASERREDLTPYEFNTLNPTESGGVKGG